MAKKATYKLFNGIAFDEIHFKTSIEQVEGLEDRLSDIPTSFTETDPTVPSHVKSITTGNISSWNGKTTQAWVTANTRSNAWTPTWAQVSGKPSTMTSTTVVQASPENAEDGIRFINPWDLKNSIIDVNDTSGYIKSVSYDKVIGPKPPVNATTNTGTVTNVSAGAQVSGLSLSVATGTTTPVITTTIANATHFRAAIGAGTSSLTIGTTAGTAKEGNYHPTWAQVTGKPTFETVATSGSYADLSNRPGVLSVADGSTGTGTGATFVSGSNLKSIIDNVIGNYNTETTNNKRTSVRSTGATNTAYVSELGVKNYVDGINSSLTTLINQGDSALATSKQDNLGFTPENSANKRTTIRTSGATNTAYVTEEGIKTYVESMIGSVYRPAGDWNASTNAPALSASMPANLGKVYRVSVAGTRFGYDWSVGDKLTFIEGGEVAKWDNVDDVTSVAGRKGNVVLTKSDVGLGSVNNYGIASQSAAQTGTVNNVYMTPLRTKQAITNNISDLGTVTESMISAGTDTNNRLISAYDLNRGISNAVSTRVPTSRTVNGKALSSNITLVPTDVGAAPASHTHTIAQVDGLQAALNAKSGTGHTHSAATQSAAGFLSAADKIRLDGIATGAQVNVGTNLDITQTGTTNTITSSTGDNAVITGATYTQAGLVTAGAQTIGGVKTFNSIPVLPSTTPSNVNHAVRKGYVDDKTNGTLKQVSWNSSTGTMVVGVN